MPVFRAWPTPRREMVVRQTFLSAPRVLSPARSHLEKRISAAAQPVAALRGERQGGIKLQRPLVVVQRPLGAAQRLVRQAPVVPADGALGRQGDADREVEQRFLVPA